MTHQMIEEAKNQGRNVLTEIESKTVLNDAGIAVTETILAKTKEEAQAISKKEGFPVALKIVSNDITHKTDAGGVELNIADEAQVAEAYDKMIASAKAKYPDAAIDGISVQKMAEKGVEVIIGMSKDPQFGPMLMFGLGGIFVELLKDVSFKIVPLREKDAKAMLSEINARPMLQGFRGSEPVNEQAIVDTLMKLSSFIEANPEIEELDMNPLFATKDGLVAVDARIAI